MTSVWVTVGALAVTTALIRASGLTVAFGATHTTLAAGEACSAAMATSYCISITECAPPSGMKPYCAPIM